MWKSLKRWPVLVALLVATGLLTVALFYLPHGNRVTRANCERIKEGMTEAEVRAILGKPWDGDESLFDPDPPSSRDVKVLSERLRALDSAESRKVDPYLRGKYWAGNNLVVFVAFDGSGRVTFPRLLICDSASPQTSLLSRVRRRLRQRLAL